MNSSDSKKMSYSSLAINGGSPAKQFPCPPMYPGGMMIDREEEQAVLETLQSKRLFRYYGPYPGPSKAEQLEAEFSKLFNSRHALAVTSGTAALVCALHGLGIGPGDEVIIPGYTWIATASAVLAVGAVPIIAEVDDSLTLDPSDIEKNITRHTKAIIPVHMRGVPCQMDQLIEIASRYNLKILEDSAQAVGASYHQKRLGTIGDVGIYSLQFNKVITAGEGGMVLTDDPIIWQRAVMFHDPIAGLRNRFPAEEVIWGINFRMPELLAAVSLVQIRRLDDLLFKMRERKQFLTSALEPELSTYGIEFQKIPDVNGDASVALIFFLPDATKTRQFCDALVKENIPASFLYDPQVVDYHVYAHWRPIMDQREWSPQGSPWQLADRKIQYQPDMCPKTLNLLSRAVHLDVSPLLTNQDLEEIIDGVMKVTNAIL